MSRKETLLQLFLVWLAVYPSVTIFSYAFGWFGIDWPLFLEILVSTALTVPLITFVAQPIIFRRIARMRGESPSALMRREAERKARAEG